MITVLNEKNYEENTQKGLKLVEFFAPWCGHCVRQNGVLEELDKIWIGQVNTDEEQQLTQKKMITSLPTFIIMKDGQEMARFFGFHSKFDIMNNINQFIK